MISAPTMVLTPADVGIAAPGSTSPARGKGNGRKAVTRKKIEVWRCRCGRDGVVKIVQLTGRYQIYCPGCLP